MRTQSSIIKIIVMALAFAFTLFLSCKSSDDIKPLAKSAEGKTRTLGAWHRQ
jgi:hypothetical protein